MTRKWWLVASIAALVTAQAATVQAAALCQQGPKAKKGPKALADFARWDRNGDGVIDQAEFQQAVKKVRRFAGRERGQRGPEARRGKRGPRAQGRGHHGRQARHERGPGGEMGKRIEAVVRRTVKQTLREMHSAAGPRHGEQGARDGFGPRGPKHGKMRGHGGKRHGRHDGSGHGGQRHHADFDGPRHQAGFGGHGTGPMLGGPRDNGCPACGCQCGGKGKPKGEFRKGGKRGRGGEGHRQFRKNRGKGGQGKGSDAHRRGRGGRGGDGPAARERGPRGRKGDGPPARLMEMFKRQDVNGDGVVTADEFMGPPDRFEMLDANGDGAVDRKELKKVMKRAKKGHGGKKGRAGKKGRGHKEGHGHGPHGDV